MQIADEVLVTRLHSDPLLLRTILSNLIDNAVKYSPPAEPVQVMIESKPQISVSGILIRIDNAVSKAGLPDPTCVFAKYYRAPGAHQQSGSGLGLYIAKALALKLGGTLDYIPQPSRVLFQLWLPL